MNGKPRDMDINFAIKVLSTAKVVTESMHGNIKRYGYQNQTFYDIARNMATKALKKQIPKNPIIHGYREGREINTISYTCPTCQSHVSRTNYCPNCGQTLDWSDTK